jgi:hypothetical protein
MSTTFIAVYRGPTISSARLVTVSVDPALVADVVDRVLGEAEAAGDDPVAGAIVRGRRAALRAIRKEALAADARTATR